MAGKIKCSDEEKISAVEDYLNGIRTVSESMTDLSISNRFNCNPKLQVRLEALLTDNHWNILLRKKAIINIRKMVRIEKRPSITYMWSFISNFFR